MYRLVAHAALSVRYCVGSDNVMSDAEFSKVMCHIKCDSIMTLSHITIVIFTHITCTSRPVNLTRAVGKCGRGILSYMKFPSQCSFVPCLFLKCKKRIFAVFMFGLMYECTNEYRVCSLNTNWGGN